VEGGGRGTGGEGKRKKRGGGSEGKGRDGRGEGRRLLPGASNIFGLELLPPFRRLPTIDCGRASTALKWSRNCAVLTPGESM